MNTLLGHEIDPLTRGLVYLCEYRYPKLVVVSELQFVDPYIALEAYANIPNPASQLARGNTHENFLAELRKLHEHINNPEWCEALNNYL